MNLKADIHLMRFLFLYILMLFIDGQDSFAQEIIKAQDVSRKFELQIQIDACGGENHNDDPGNCSGVLRIYTKGAKSPLQLLNLPNVQIYNKETIACDPRMVKKLRGLYEGKCSFILQDFNFDGSDDLGICTGHNGPYGSSTYKVYLFNKRSNKFVENRSLTRLTEDNIGLFSIDPEKKQLITFSKSGCCYHETGKYRVLNNNPKLVEKIVEDETGGDRIITTRKLINGKWVRRVRKQTKSSESNKRC